MSGVILDRLLWLAGNLTIHDRILHYFLYYMMVPIYLNHSSITNVEMKVLYAIKNNIYVN